MLFSQSHKRQETNNVVQLITRHKVTNHNINNGKST